MKDLCFLLKPHFHVKIERLALAGEKAEKEIWLPQALATVSKNGKVNHETH